jgi:hypothetical protein
VVERFLAGQCHTSILPSRGFERFSAGIL